MDAINDVRKASTRTVGGGAGSMHSQVCQQCCSGAPGAARLIWGVGQSGELQTSCHSPQAWPGGSPAEDPRTLWLWPGSGECDIETYQ